MFNFWVLSVKSLLAHLQHTISSVFKYCGKTLLDLSVLQAIDLYLVHSYQLTLLSTNVHSYMHFKLDLPVWTEICSVLLSCYPLTQYCLGEQQHVSDIVCVIHWYMPSLFFMPFQKFTDILKEIAFQIYQNYKINLYLRIK